MLKALDLYLIQARNGRSILFSPLDVVEAFEAESGDRILRFTSWLMAHRNRVVAWVGRVLNAGHRYYVKLEDRIDPLERVLKAMSFTPGFVVHHAPSASEPQVRARFESILRRQRWKHILWFGADVIVSGFVAIFTPFLAPIPGPNVFFYYPFLRLLSHYRAIRGTASGLNPGDIRFKCLPELSGLEENLRTPRFDRRAVSAVAEALNIRGLEQFLERMV